MSYYPQTIANKMEKGLTKEVELYAAISKALREDGNSKSQVSYYMSVDEDFIPDVLQAYKMTKKTQEQLRQEGLRAARNMVRKFKAREKIRKSPSKLSRS